MSIKKFMTVFCCLKTCYALIIYLSIQPEDQAELLLSSGMDTADIDGNPAAADQRMPYSGDPQSKQGNDDCKSETVKMVQSQLHTLSLEGVPTSQNISQTTTSEDPSVPAPLIPLADKLGNEPTPLRETLIDRLYAVTTKGKQDGTRRAKKNRGIYQFRRTVKVCMHLRVNAMCSELVISMPNQDKIHAHSSALF